MKKVVLLFLIGIAFNAKAQDITQNFAAAQQQPLMASHSAIYPQGAPGLPGFKHRVELTVFAGTQGLGGDIRYGFLPRLTARIGAGVTPVNLPNLVQVNEFNSQVSLNVNFTNVHLIADFQPFGGSGLRLAFGAGYFIKGDATGTVTPDEAAKYGNITLTAEQLGNMTITSSWQGVAPYLGLGFFRTFPRLFFNITADLGTYYLPAPQTTIIATGALQPNEANNDQLQQNLSAYRWLPVIQLNFNFKL